MTFLTEFHKEGKRRWGQRGYIPYCKRHEVPDRSVSACSEMTYCSKTAKHLGDYFSQEIHLSNPLRVSL
ncbi:hypothetical protein HNY73_000310 [Argiope bruennichi]|uniref:Uncharacterized protein n=1 Tax=Argiope bruennichi TaxID=94029 RepID=A0A8T0G1Z4_ARGBR|nr:hypothetical protein HNY73_000310 [Argiope bruennichi]